MYGLPTRDDAPASAALPDKAKISFPQKTQDP